MKQCKELASWIALERHAQELEQSVADSRSHGYKLRALNIEMDYSCQRVNQETIGLLLKLANECNLKAKINTLMEGGIVNIGHNLPALHTAIRTMDKKSLFFEGKDIISDILLVREQMCAISNQIRNGAWVGHTGKAISSIVNIGMGGSDFGPKFCVNALSEFVADHIDYHFVSDIDPLSFEHTIKKLNPETTLFIISSKSFTTPETLYNARKAIAWINSPNHLNRHFIAVTANIKRAQEFGFSQTLPIWEWVGGRYSFCSAINLITCIAIGPERFIELLTGAYNMDQHFSSCSLHENMPVILALLGLWNINFLQTSNLLLLIYAKQLELLVPYIQQLDMESNGKSVDNLGRAVNYSTGPIVWGGLGNQAQHSYYQLLCQGNHKIAADFISIKKYDNEVINSFCNGQIKVLSNGMVSLDNPNSHIAGGMPINHIKIDSCTPFNLGSLIALYEHKIYVQSVLWNINPFDQPGVESAKQINQIAKRHLTYDY